MKRVILIRYDNSTASASVLDLIRTLTGCRSNHAAALLGMLRDKNRTWIITKGRINQKGRLTPLASKETLLQIMHACPPLRRADRPACCQAKITMLLDTVFTIQTSRSKSLNCKKTATKTKRRSAIVSRLSTCPRSFGPLSAMIRVTRLHV